jgi:hypothetical protein
VTYFRDVANYGLLIVAVLFLLRHWRRPSRWFAIAAGTVLLLPLTMLWLEALLRSDAGGGRAFRTWPFPSPTYGPNLALWGVFWVVALALWVPRAGGRGAAG